MPQHGFGNSGISSYSSGNKMNILITLFVVSAILVKASERFPTLQKFIRYISFLILGFTTNLPLLAVGSLILLNYSTPLDSYHEWLNYPSSTLLLLILSFIGWYWSSKIFHEQKDHGVYDLDARLLFIVFVIDIGLYSALFIFNFWLFIVFRPSFIRALF